MNRLMLVVLVLAAMVATAVMAVPSSVPPSARVAGPVVMTGLEDGVTTGDVPENRPVSTPLDDWTPNSIVDTMGWTYYDLQTNGTAGKQIGVDAQGFVHIAFMTGTNPGSSDRHVYYNVWDPTTQDFMLQEGVPVDQSQRAGFCNLVVAPSGWGYPMFHQVTTSTPHSAAAIDFQQRQGAFTVSEIPYLNNMQLIWPHGALDIDGNIHTVSTDGATGTTYAAYYAKGHPTFEPNPPDSFGLNIEWPIGFTQMDEQSFITYDVAASWHTRKIALAWLNNPSGSDVMQNDVYYKTSTDGGQTWGGPRNITNFHQVDPNCCANIGDPNICNGDTMQPWLDLSVLIDRNDVVHVAFSAGAFWYFDDTCTPTTSPHGFIYSTIWHWDSQSQLFSRIAEQWAVPSSPDFTGAGVNNIMIQRPSLAQDTLTGYMYCSFQKFDTSAVNSCGRPMADAWVSVSTNGGCSWAVATNVTNTAPTPTDDRSERDITIAPVVDGYVHMEYMVDHVSGSYSSTQPECTESHNEMIYQRIPVGDIATEPLEPPYPLRADSTGFPGTCEESARQVPGLLPQQFALYQNYPNPFNPNTNIQFDLASAAKVSLKVFDITGREVAVLVNNEALGAGAHVVEFNAANLPSGVYFYRLNAMGHQFTRKMLLVK